MVGKKEVKECLGALCKHYERNCTFWVSHIEDMKKMGNENAPNRVKPSYHYY